jgi:NhaA family Na+:H+ antiporter
MKINIRLSTLGRLFREFYDSEKTAGFLLFFLTVFSMLLSNSEYAKDWVALWGRPLAGQQLEFWINDGLMTLFFLMIGLELEREIYIGELSNPRNALMPLLGALGGALLPAGIYLAFNAGTIYSNGAGIPMATDIAFSLAVLSLLGNRVPVSLRIFLTALAVSDDLLAILIIAFFYSGGVQFSYLLICGGIFALLLLLNRFKVMSLWPYLIGGAFLWHYIHHAGIHATLAGVLVAFAIPFGDGSDSSPSYRLQHFLHKPVAFLILPLFGLANTAITIDHSMFEALREPLGLGIIAGLVLGKPLGIFLICFLSVKMGLSKLPPAARWIHLLGVGQLAGIGFTMSIFISLLAFNDLELINQSKLAVLIASVMSGVIGLIILFMGPVKNDYGYDEGLSEETENAE